MLLMQNDKVEYEKDINLLVRIVDVVHGVRTLKGREETFAARLQGTAV